MIQLISLRFNYKRKSPSYPSPLDRGSMLPNKLPLVSQESLNYSFYFSFNPLFPLSSPSPPPVFISLSSCSRTYLCFLFRTGLRMRSNYHHWFPTVFGLRPFIAEQCLLMMPCHWFHLSMSSSSNDCFIWIGLSSLRRYNSPVFKEKMKCHDLRKQKN